MGRQRFRQALTVRGAGPRHRNQDFHRYLRRDGAAAHLLLHAGGKQLDQGQAVRYPAQTAVKAAG